MLFRGINGGLDAELSRGYWSLSADHSPQGALERELGVYLLSHELSDALTIARFWEDRPDAALYVFASEQYWHRAQQRKAAMLAFAEPGVVFKYPFLAEPLPVANIEAIIVSTTSKFAHDIYKNIWRLPPGVTGRADIETAVLKLLNARNWIPATPIRADHYPHQTRDN